MARMRAWRIMFQRIQQVPSFSSEKISESLKGSYGFVSSSADETVTDRCIDEEMSKADLIFKIVRASALVLPERRCVVDCKTSRLLRSGTKSTPTQHDAVQAGAVIEGLPFLADSAFHSIPPGRSKYGHKIAYILYIALLRSNCTCMRF